jgi:hypothetical protein
MFYLYFSIVSGDEDIKKCIDNSSVSSPITPRDGLYGGRCDAFTLYKKAIDGVKIKYIDIQSLYPYCCKVKRYPVGHPEVILNVEGLDVSEFEGLVKCRVLPPDNLYHPVLPMHMGDKLLFPLCYTCADLKSSDACMHTDKQRALEGTWVTPELKKAVELGYQIITIYEVWHYKSTTMYDPTTGKGGIFAGYIENFLKTKMESSGYPKECRSDGEKDRYIARIKTHENILLDKGNIEFNPGLRALSKLCLNNLWGKLSQRPIMQTRRYITAPAEFYKLLNRDKYDLGDAIPIGEDCIFTTFKRTANFAEPSANTNPVVASYVTAHARLELYKYLDMLGDRAMYCDTDSVVYSQRDGDVEPELSEYMGGMTDEIPVSKLMHTLYVNI